MIRKIEIPTFLRNFNVMNNGCIDFFLGSGSSAQAGIPTGGGLVWEFKRNIYCTETGTSKEKFRDLQSKTAQRKLQKHFDAQGNHPALYESNEYSHYFELCHTTSVARKQFVQYKVRDIAPSLGHLCLAELFIDNKIQNIWTTNFDELIESGIKTIRPEQSFSLFSSANRDAILNSVDGSFPSIIKLHGDYRYDKIKNTSSELINLEASMKKQFKDRLYGKGVIFIGYSGCDESIMQVLEEHIKEEEFLKYGLTWMIPNGGEISKRVSALMEKACNINESSGIVEIPGFDEFMYQCYKLQDKPNTLIEARWIDFPKRKLPISFPGQQIESFIKTNTFISLDLPRCKVFDTDITSWKELKDIIAEKDIIAALFSSRIYCFEDEKRIQNVFQKHILSEIRGEVISNKILYRYDSIYTGMLYQLIKTILINKLGLISFGKNKYFDPNSKSVYENIYYIYDGIEITLSVYNGKYYLSVVLTVFIQQINGKDVNRLKKQQMINKVMSGIYNNKYDEKLKYWNKKLKTPYGQTISFSNNGFTLSFISIILSCGGIKRNSEWPTLTAYQYDEPQMLFDVKDKAHKAINQLIGINKFGPIDYSYSKEKLTRDSIKLLIISPKQQISKILTHLNSLNQKHSPRNKQDGYLQLYNGFEQIYKRGIQIPSETDDSYVITYDQANAKSLNISDFLSLLKSFIDKIATKHNFDIAVIYIPAIFSKFRESEDPEDDFNLHDALKLYATDKSVKLQFIEDKSIQYYDPCKVRWGLSTSLYAKASGSLWQPVTLNDSTAFVGISYAQSKTKGICIGCSQLFDSTGTGIRLLLQKIDDPEYHGKNPFMKKDEARAMMSSLREQYYKCDPTAKLNRIVVHKTTPFTQEEITGFTQALEGIDDIELLQIQEYCPWRAIRFKNNISNEPENFAIKRGTVIALNSDTFLLWTHGCVIHEELKGRLNYYKGGRGIPVPLIVKRFYGKALGDVLVKEILMLSKMNWNSGDSLYKTLPVTLDFAKVLSRMAKQEEAIYDQAYDFRYFM